MKTQYDWDYFFLQFAWQCAKQSYDPKRRVGCVIVRGDQILAYSYNGTVPGQSNVMRDDNGKTLPSVIHAEAHAIAKVARSSQSTEGATLYCTLAPCIECSKLMVTAGISRLVFEVSHKEMKGIEFLKETNKMEVTQYDGDRIFYHAFPSHEDYADPVWVASSTGL